VITKYEFGVSMVLQNGEHPREHSRPFCELKHFQ